MPADARRFEPLPPMLLCCSHALLCLCACVPGQHTAHSAQCVCLCTPAPGRCVRWMRGARPCSPPCWFNVSSQPVITAEGRGHHATSTPASVIVTTTTATTTTTMTGRVRHAGTDPWDRRREQQIAVERGGGRDFAWAQRADGKISLIGYPWLGRPPAHERPGLNVVQH